MSRTIEYEITLDDLIAFHDYHRNRLPQRRIFDFVVRLFGAIFIGFGIMVTLMANKMIENASIALGLGVLGGIAMFFIAGYQMRNKPRNEIRQQAQQQVFKDILGPHTLTIDPDGLSYGFSAGETRIQWAGVETIANTNDALYFYTGGSTAYIVPRRAFSDEAAWLGFIQEARGYHKGPLRVPHA